MGSVLSWLTGSKKDPRTPVTGFPPRIKNIFRVHFRGLLGVFVPLFLLSWQPSKGRHDITVRCIWMLMFWFMLIQPMAAPAAGFIPLFMFPMFGVLQTVKVAGSYFNDSVCLFVLAGMMQMLLNSSGLDRRLILWLLCSGDNCQFAGKRIIFKACTAAFFLSMFSNRLITTSTIIQFLTPALMNLQNFIICHLGSITIIHAALTPIAMRAIWSSNVAANEEYADIFNYLSYTCFAFPVAFLMFIFNFLYHMMLINCVIGKAMSANSMTEMRNFLVKQQNALPPRSCFEMETAFFYVLFLIACLFRWSEWLNFGWATFNTNMPGAPQIKDATVAALFIVALSILPRSHNFLKYINAQKKSDLKNLKPESSILWWKFVDKNTYYGYIILLGGAVALNTAIKVTGLTKAVTTDYGTFITNKSWNSSIFIVCLISVLLANIMTGIAACCTFLPFVLNMAGEGVSEAWQKRLYLGTLGVGIGTSFGFVSPFYFTPAYFCHHTGKVPQKKMVKYGIGSAIICMIILWLALCFYAPIIFDPDYKGIPVYQIGTAGTAETTTAAPPPP